MDDKKYKSYDEYLKIVDEVIKNGTFKDNWESLSKWKTPQWYKEGRFGIFSHWGVYSVPACVNEWYPRLMYDKLNKAYQDKVSKYGKDFDYHEFIPKFKPEKFDANEWVKVVKESGARYFMPVGEHHDGIKMYESDLNRWNMMDINGRDYIMEIKNECQRQGIGFLTSNHRAEHFWFFNMARANCPDSAVVKDESLRDLYGPAFLPESGNAGKTDKEIFATDEYLKDWLASACEQIDRLQPLGVYFDWWIHKTEFKPYLKKFLAYYYNRALEWGKEVTVFYKWGAIMQGCATLDVERGQTKGAMADLWQNDTSISKGSWGYTENNTFKDSNDIIRNLIEVISKNGCYMLNMGPKADGSLNPIEVDILRKIGSWLKVNGEAIYGTEPFEVAFGEGKKLSGGGAFSEKKKFYKCDYRFTFKIGSIYIFPMTKRTISELTIKSLRKSNEKGIRYQIKDVKVLGTNDIEINWKQSEKAFKVCFSKPVDNTIPHCIKVTID